MDSLWSKASSSLSLPSLSSQPLSAPSELAPQASNSLRQSLWRPIQRRTDTEQAQQSGKETDARLASVVNEVSELKFKLDALRHATMAQKEDVWTEIQQMQSGIDAVRRDRAIETVQAQLNKSVT